MTTEVTKTKPEMVEGSATTNSVENSTQRPVFVPRVDIWETDDEIVLYGELPGVDKDALEISFENRQLTIHGKVNERHADMRFVGGEFAIGDFHRIFTIGEAIDADKISAELKNGVLVLHLPKSEAVKPRRIQVQAG